MSAIDLSKRKATPETKLEDVCPTCREFVKLTSAAPGDVDDDGEQKQACSDPDCLSAHGYGENGVCECVVRGCPRDPCKGQCGCKPCEHSYYDAIEYD